MLKFVWNASSKFDFTLSEPTHKKWPVETIEEWQLQGYKVNWPPSALIFTFFTVQLDNVRRYIVNT